MLINVCSCGSKSETRQGFQPNMTYGGAMPAFAQGIPPNSSLSGVRPEIPQGVYGFPHYGNGVVSRGLSSFIPYVGYPLFNKNLHCPVYLQFPQATRISKSKVEAGSLSFIHCVGNVDFAEDPWTEINGTRTQNNYDSSSNSNSSIISRLSASSGDSNYKTTGPSELEANADSFTCRQPVVTILSMVGGGRTSRNRGMPTAPKESPRGRGRPPSASKRKRAIDFIEISSSNNVNVEDNGETEHISPMNVHKNDKSSLRSNLDNNSNSKMDQVVLNEAITNVITNLSKTINSNPDFSPHTHSALSMLLNNLVTPMNSSVTNQSQIDNIMEKLASPKTLVGSPPLVKGSTGDGNICPNYVKKLFPQDEKGNNFSFLNYDPLNGCKHPGRTTGIEIPEWMPTLFPIPASMILDEIEAAVSLYIFGSNKDDQKFGKEVLINYTCWGQGNRETLKSLMPNKEVDQEIFLPINDEKHWYLLVVDKSKQQLILLDSKPDRKRSMWRKLYVQKMVGELQNLHD
ncbi:hypothetical protein RIF29_39445 [Crotalaria pallida]|uniref:Ubiquitin-like protease family profile domain-containing protein n=1 Tax=Crotalaria pallida TaxID=3830 RepID=A0AAN9HMH5_CROPI